MKKQRFFSLVLAICLLAMSGPAALAAGDSGAFVVSDAAGKAGETVTVTVSVENNPGIIAAAMRINYDSDKLELVAVQDEKLMTGTTTFSQNYTADPYYVSWNDALASENTKVNGVLVTLTFRILEDCPDGTSEIGLTFRPGDVFNKDMQNQSFTAVGGTVTIGTPSNDGSGDTGGSNNAGDTGNNSNTGDAGNNTGSGDNGSAEGTGTGNGSGSGNAGNNGTTTVPGTPAMPGQAPVQPVKPATPDYSAYRDLAAKVWYREYVEFMLEKGYMNGVAADRFDPNGNVSRAQLVTILYRAAGEPAVTGRVGFNDVEAGSWYDAAVTWSSFAGVVTGVGDNRFAPQQDITREQLAVMLYRYSGSPVVRGEYLSGFSDANTISAYAKDAMNWAVEQGILTGADGKLSPGATATRVQAAAMLTRYLKAASVIPVPGQPGVLH